MVAPSGICTSRSIIALRIRQWRPTLTCEQRMLESISEYEFTRTSRERTHVFTRLPETMQPMAMMESTADPVGPASLNTNFAGGYCRWWVRIGQWSSYKLNTGDTDTMSMLAS